MGKILVSQLRIPFTPFAIKWYVTPQAYEALLRLRDTQIELAPDKPVPTVQQVFWEIKLIKLGYSVKQFWRKIRRA